MKENHMSNNVNPLVNVLNTIAAADDTQLQFLADLIAARRSDLARTKMAASVGKWTRQDSATRANVRLGQRVRFTHASRTVAGTVIKRNGKTFKVTADGGGIWNVSYGVDFEVM
jgi:hypothetical protein